MTKAVPGLYNPRARERQLTLYVPGRRSLDEEWSVVTIDVVDKGEYVVERREAEEDERPADNRPLIVAARDDSHVSDVLQSHVGKAMERTKRAVSEMSPEERYRLVNEAWQEYAEQKLRWYRGQSTIGSRLYQRQRFEREPNL